MGLSAGEMVFSLPAGIYATWLSLSAPQQPWVSWAYTRFDFDVIPRYPMKLIQSDPTNYRAYMLNQWAFPLGGLLFFLWFGFAGEAMEEYKRIFYKVVAPLGIKPKAKPTAVHSQPTWYVFFSSSIFRYL
jgi:pheromone a factor receptor